MLNSKRTVPADLLLALSARWRTTVFAFCVDEDEGYQISLARNGSLLRHRPDIPADGTWVDEGDRLEVKLARFPGAGPDRNGIPSPGIESTPPAP